jgi:hypothetical protein
MYSSGIPNEANTPHDTMLAYRIWVSRRLLPLCRRDAFHPVADTRFRMKRRWASECHGTRRRQLDAERRDAYHTDGDTFWIKQRRTSGRLRTVVSKLFWSRIPISVKINITPRWCIFKGDKNPQHTFLRMGSKAGDPMSCDFTAC